MSSLLREIARDPFSRIPPRHLDDYRARQTELLRSRVPLLCLTASAIFYVVSGQYIFRQFLVSQETFRVQELVLWALLFAGDLFVLYMNRRPAVHAVHRGYAFLFNFLFSFILGGIGVVYSENALVFPIYFALSLLLSSLVLPLGLIELTCLSALYALMFSFFYGYVRVYLGVEIPSFSRFHPLADGLILIAIAWLMSIIIRKKEIDRDVENYVLLRDLGEKNRQIEEELELAAQVHQSLIPDSARTRKADISISYVPMRQVGGDYAKYKFLDEDRLMVFISDVTGHGVPAAFLVNRLHAEFERLAMEEGCDPAELLRRLNQFVLRDFGRTNMYLSAFCGLLDFDRMIFSYCNYGHPDQYLYQISSSSVYPLRAERGLLGLAYEEQPAQGGACLQTSFQAGDSLLLFTDGLIEAMNPAGDFYGEARIVDFLKRHHHLSDGQLNLRLLEEVQNFRKGSFNDDIFILNIKTKKTSGG